MGILNDRDIRALANAHGMITPFRDYGGSPAGSISSGLSSFGYDARLGNRFKVFRVPLLIEEYDEPLDVLVDPKYFDERGLVEEFVGTEYLDIRPHGFVLGYTVERFSIPVDVCAIATGKSTYARCGLIVTPTPLEPGWEGHVTVEITNVTDYTARVYVGEGICQFQFHRGLQPEATYNHRSGKYRDQGPEPVVARG